jgi:hypothetical protein
MPSKVQQAARASHERRESQRAASSAETPPSSSNMQSVESFGLGSHSPRRTGSRGSGTNGANDMIQRPSSTSARGVDQRLPNPPANRTTTRPPNTDDESIPSPPRSARSSLPSPAPTTSTGGDEMGEEASVRFLKAKITVLQQQVLFVLMSI